MSIFRSLLALVAGVTLTLNPVVVSAQVASAPQPAVQSSSAAGVYAQRAGIDLIAPGVWANQAESDMFYRLGCSIGPVGLVAEHLAEMEEDGIKPCSTEWWGKLSGVVKKGVQYTSMIRAFNGVKVANTDKGLNLNPNSGDFCLYSFDPRSNGKPVYCSDSKAANGAMVMSDIVKTATGAMLNGVGATVAGSLLAEKCKNCGDTFNLSGGTALAQSQQKTEVGLVSQILVESAAAGGCGTAGACRD